jgi:ABC-2 type transport system ATP-binding protein
MVAAMSMLELAGLGKDYGGRTAVRSLDLVVEKGEILGLLGPNGAGKTTTISMVCGVVTPTRGRVVVNGTDLARQPRVAKAKLGYVPQELALYGIHGTVAAARVSWALGVVGLADRAHDVVKTYSGGMQRRLNIAVGLVHEPELLVLDEPTVGVDPQSRNHIFETVRTLRASGMTVIYTSHYMEEVEALCDRVAIMDDGAIAALGTIPELVATYAGRGIEIEISGDAAVAERAVVAHATVTREGKVLRVEPSAGLAPVIAAIEASGVTIARIESRQASLETAFLALTGKALRDHA